MPEGDEKDEYEEAKKEELAGADPGRLSARPGRSAATEEPACTADGVRLTRGRKSISAMTP